MDFQEAKNFLLEHRITQADHKVFVNGHEAMYLGLAINECGSYEAVVRYIGDEILYRYHPSRLVKDCI